MEDLIERERAALGHNQTKVTLVSFLAWKKRKLREKEDSNTKENAKKKEAFKAGRSVGVSCFHLQSESWSLLINNLFFFL